MLAVHFPPVECLFGRSFNKQGARQDMSLFFSRKANVDVAQSLLLLCCVIIISVSDGTLALLLDCLYWNKVSIDKDRELMVFHWINAKLDHDAKKAFSSKENTEQVIHSADMYTVADKK